jgi:hypothetical protein
MRRDAARLGKSALERVLLRFSRPGHFPEGCVIGFPPRTEIQEICDGIGPLKSLAFPLQNLSSK